MGLSMCSQLTTVTRALLHIRLLGSARDGEPALLACSGQQKLYPGFTFPFLRSTVGLFGASVRNSQDLQIPLCQDHSRDSDFGSKALKVRLPETFYNAVDITT